ncbi:MAG TPA: hypothetical protein VLH61_06380, partial [Bacteroidales bacterium]|nr:hypothetical protein [Bacteroidales bacterium]
MKHLAFFVNLLAAAMLTFAATGLSANLKNSGIVNYTVNNIETMNEESKKFVLPALPYAYDALEPYIDQA